MLNSNTTQIINNQIKNNQIPEFIDNGGFVRGVEGRRYALPSPRQLTLQMFNAQHDNVKIVFEMAFFNRVDDVHDFFPSHFVSHHDVTPKWLLVYHMLKHSECCMSLEN